MNKEITKEQFAKWSLERDLSAGCYDDEDLKDFGLNSEEEISWETLPEDEKNIYLQEAEYYLRLPRDEWPEDILERL